MGVGDAKERRGEEVINLGEGFGCNTVLSNAPPPPTPLFERSFEWVVCAWVSPAQPAILILRKSHFVRAHGLWCLFVVRFAKVPRASARVEFACALVGTFPTRVRDVNCGACKRLGCRLLRTPLGRPYHGKMPRHLFVRAGNGMTKSKGAGKSCG